MQVGSRVYAFARCLELRDECAFSCLGWWSGWVPRPSVDGLASLHFSGRRCLLSAPCHVRLGRRGPVGKRAHVGNAAQLGKMVRRARVADWPTEDPPGRKATMDLQAHKVCPAKEVGQCCCSNALVRLGSLLESHGELPCISTPSSFQTEHK